MTRRMVGRTGRRCLAVLARATASPSRVDSRRLIDAGVSVRRPIRETERADRTVEIQRAPRPAEPMAGVWRAFLVNRLTWRGSSLEEKGQLLFFYVALLRGIGQIVFAFHVHSVGGEPAVP